MLYDPTVPRATPDALRIKLASDIHLELVPETRLASVIDEVASQPEEGADVLVLAGEIG